jgi:hypothetical protein
VFIHLLDEECYAQFVSLSISFVVADAEPVGVLVDAASFAVAASRML